jgi:hypothetical protein
MPPLLPQPGSSFINYCFRILPHSCLSVANNWRTHSGKGTASANLSSSAVKETREGGTLSWRLLCNCAEDGWSVNQEKEADLLYTAGYLSPSW